MLRSAPKGLKSKTENLRKKGKYVKTSDVDPDQIGSAYIWIRGSESRGIK